MRLARAEPSTAPAGVVDALTIRLRPKCAHECECAIARNNPLKNTERSYTRGFLRSPLPDSNRRPLPYHSTTQCPSRAENGSRRRTRRAHSRPGPVGTRARAPRTPPRGNEARPASAAGLHAGTLSRPTRISPTASRRDHNPANRGFLSALLLSSGAFGTGGARPVDSEWRMLANSRARFRSARPALAAADLAAKKSTTPPDAGVLDRPYERAGFAFRWPPANRRPRTRPLPARVNRSGKRRPGTVCSCSG